jgi:hypothetical protein
VVLHLAPYKLAGFNVCPMAELAGCVAGCLNTAGRGGIVKHGETTNAIQQARIRKTRLLVEDRERDETDLRFLDSAGGSGRAEGEGQGEARHERIRRGLRPRPTCAAIEPLTQMGPGRPGELHPAAGSLARPP